MGGSRRGRKGTWKLKADFECVTTKVSDDGTETTSNRTSSGYELSTRARTEAIDCLRYAGLPRSDYGRVACNYTITNHGDGDKVYEGAWVVPEKPKEWTVTMTP